MSSERDSILTGSAGEHFVLFQLLRQGVLASLSPANAYLADIIAFSPSMSAGAMVQVKTRTRGRDGGWHMRERHEHIVHDRLFYVLVDLEVLPHACFVVPSEVIATVLQASHQAWLRVEGRGGRGHRDNPLRRLLPAYSYDVPGFPPGWLEGYRDRWDLITVEGQPETTRTATAPGSFSWSLRPGLIDPTKPLIYCWEVEKPEELPRYVYVGRAKDGAVRRMREYRRNVENLLAGRPYRASAPDGFRVVHRELADAVRSGFPVHLTYLANVKPGEDINKVERHWQEQYGLRRPRGGAPPAAIGD